MNVIGYPTSQNTKMSYNPFASSNPVRKHEKGVMESVDRHEIKYRINTVKGQSGGPVMVEDEDGEMVVVGIHTHAGLKVGVNSGLYFTNEIIEEIKRRENEIRNKDEKIGEIKYCTLDLRHSQLLMKKELEDEKEKKEMIKLKK